jgi:uncharacterized membrane protein
MDLRSPKGSSCLVPPAESQRDLGLDALRGLAIVTMVAAHLTREALDGEHPFWLRAFGSIAAPLFITLCGVLVAQTRQQRHYPLGRYLARARTIVLLAACMDVLLWGVYPFVGGDVLYLIGVALPLAALWAALSPAWQTAGLVAVAIGAEALRSMLGYPKDVLFFTLDKSPLEVIRHAPTIAQQWLVSGWFPLLPWAFFAFLGVRLYQWRQADAEKFPSRIRRLGFALAAAGLLAAGLLPAPSYIRSGYSELFYPATMSFLVAATGGVLVLFSFAGAAWLRACRPLVQLGQCSLLMYVVHLVLIRCALPAAWRDVDLGTYLMLYAVLILVLFALAEFVDDFKRRAERPLPLVLRFLLGG